MLKRTNGRNCIIIACLFLIMALVAAYSPLNPLTGTGMTADQGVFFTIAKGLTQGELAYVDYFDHKGPLLYFILALGLEINKLVSGSVSASFVGNFAIELVVIFIAVLFMYKIARLYADEFISVVTVAAIFLCNIRLYTSSNSEEYIFPMICAAAWLFLLQIRDGINNKYALIMGALGMLTFFIKFNYCILWAVMGITMFAMMAISAILGRRGEAETQAQGGIAYGVGDIIRMCASFFAGMLLAAFPFVIYLFATKSFAAFIDTYVIFSLDYAGMATMAKRLQTGIDLLDVPLFVMLAGFVVILIVATIRRRNKERLKLVWAWALLSLTMFVTVSSPGQPWTYYQQAALFIYIGATAAVWDQLKTAWNWIRHKYVSEGTRKQYAGILQVGGGAVTLAVMAFLLRGQLTPANFAIGEDERQQSILNVSATIEDAREDGDTLISFADDCGMYFYTDCQPASRIIFPSASIIKPALAEELIEDLEERPAAFMTFTDGWTFGIPEVLTDWVDETLANDYELIYDDGLRTIYKHRD